MTTTQGAGTIEIAGKQVSRLGFGTMRLTGRGIWGEPADRDECVAVLQRAVEIGVQCIDTADSYGPDVAEEIIRAALHPYPDDIVIATKAGLIHNGPDVIDTGTGLKRLGPVAWPPVGRPEYLRQQALKSLRRLGLDQIDLFQLHRVDPQVPLADQVGELKKLQDEGKLIAIGLSQVTTDQLAEARQIVEIASVQSRYNLNDRSAQDVLDVCEREAMTLIPWAPLAQGGLDQNDGPLTRIAREHDASVGQVALAGLLAVSPNILPIPGTSQRAHLEDNLAATQLQLTSDELYEIGGLTSEVAAETASQTFPRRPHTTLRARLAQTLGLTEAAVRIVVPAVGGSFGLKMTGIPRRSSSAWPVRENQPGQADRVNAFTSTPSNKQKAEFCDHRIRLVPRPYESSIRPRILHL